MTTGEHHHRGVAATFQPILDRTRVQPGDRRGSFHARHRAQANKTRSGIGLQRHRAAGPVAPLDRLRDGQDTPAV
jgi:hypothetical protein